MEIVGNNIVRNKNENPSIVAKPYFICGMILILLVATL
jgi:hypothetical protein